MTEGTKRKTEIWDALADFVLHVARDVEGKNTEAEISALPQLAEILLRDIPRIGR